MCRQPYSFALLCVATVVLCARPLCAQAGTWANLLPQAPGGGTVMLTEGVHIISHSNAYITAPGLTIIGHQNSTVLTLDTTQIVTEESVSLSNVAIAGIAVPRAADQMAPSPCPAIGAAILVCDGSIALTDVVFRHISGDAKKVVGGSIHLHEADGVLTNVHFDTPNIVAAYAGGLFIRGGSLVMTNVSFDATAACFQGSALVSVDSPVNYVGGSIAGAQGALGNASAAILVVEIDQGFVVNVEDVDIARDDGALAYETLTTPYSCALTGDDVFDGASLCSAHDGAASCIVPENAELIATLDAPCLYACVDGYVLQEVGSDQSSHIRDCVPCPSGAYEVHGSCLPCSTCVTGQEEAVPCTPTTNRVCTCALPSDATWIDDATCTYACNDGYARTENGCAECPEGFFAAGGSCYECLQCGPFEEETTSCTPTTNRVCGCETVPTGGHVLTTSGCEWDCAAGYVRNGPSCATCSNGTYYSLATGSCEPCTTNCGAGFEVDGACSIVADATCGPCVSVTLPVGAGFVDGNGPCSWECAASLVPPNAILIDETVDCSWTCNAGYYQLGGLCNPCQACGVGETDGGGCAGSVDRVCDTCSKPNGADFTTPGTCEWACTNLPDNATHVDDSVDCVWTCNDGFYSVGLGCAPCSACLYGFEETVACSADSDTECTPCVLSPLEIIIEAASCNFTCTYGTGIVNGEEQCLPALAVTDLDLFEPGRVYSTQELTVFGAGFTSDMTYSICNETIMPTINADATSWSTDLSTLSLPADTVCVLSVDDNMGTVVESSVFVVGPIHVPDEGAELGRLGYGIGSSAHVCLFNASVPLGVTIDLDPLLVNYTVITQYCLTITTAATWGQTDSFGVVVEFTDETGSRVMRNYVLTRRSTFFSCQEALQDGLSISGFVPIQCDDGTSVNRWCEVMESAYGTGGTVSWMLLQKGHVPHAHKSDLSYGTPQDTHYRVDSTCHTWTELLAFDTSGHWHVYDDASTGVSVWDKFSRGQQPSNSYEDTNTFYHQASGSSTAYFCFDTETLPGDTDHCKNAVTHTLSIEQDFHNSIDDYLGASFFSDSNGDYLGQNRDSDYTGAHDDFQFYAA